MMMNSKKQVWEGPDKVKTTRTSSSSASSLETERRRHSKSEDRRRDRDYSSTSRRSTRNVASSPPATPIAERVDNNDNNNRTQVIAVLGAHGVTGTYFVQLALDAGYLVHALMPPARKVPDELTQQPNYAFTLGDIDDGEAIAEVVQGSHAVVSFVSETMPSPGDAAPYPAHALEKHVRRVYAALRREANVKVLLFQANSLAPSLNGDRMPLFSHICKKLALRRAAFLHDLDRAVGYVATQHGLRSMDDDRDVVMSSPDSKVSGSSRSTTPPLFAVVVTRPSIWTTDGPSARKLAASKSQPGPFAIRHVDLAEFTLNVLLQPQHYNTSPYVVP